MSKILNFKPQIVVGHSLGEFSALVASKALNYEDALFLVSKRANAMEEACIKYPGTMAAIIGLNVDLIESVCEKVGGIIKTANYNCPGQVVISGDLRWGKVYISPLGGMDTVSVVKSLNGNVKRIQGFVASNIRLKRMPKLKFYEDPRFDFAKKITDKLYSLSKAN